MGSLDRACLPSALSSTWRLQVCGFQLSLLPRYAFGIGIFSLDMVSFQALYVFTMALASLRLPAFTPSVHAFGMVLSNLHTAALTPSALCLWHGAFHIVHGLTLLMRACHWMHATCQQPRQITHIQLSCLS